ncbi:MAG: nuclear transport factor 2 family protein [Nocardioides sp.]|nr:nuclear transport factor 2 family protein [Nocardioides sp.]
MEERIARLEAVDEIKALKHRYLRACDAKQPDVFRDCFVRSGASIDYGPRIGKFEDADGIAAVFERVALQRVEGALVIFDMHHGVHPEIEIVDATHASGAWTLRFRQVNLVEETEQVSNIEYADEYEVEDGRWRIRSCRVRTLWTLTQPLPKGFRVVDSFS